MAYIYNIDQVGAARRSPAVTSLGAKATAVAQRVIDWLVAWNEAADESAAARTTYGMCGGKITDGLEREMMRRLLRTE